MADDTVFALEGVEWRAGGCAILNGIDVSIRAGQCVALIGPSGAGKTTLLRLLGGLTWPTEGRVRSLGADTRELHGRALRELRRRVGFLHQSDNLVPGLRVVHNVSMGRLGRASLLRAALSLLFPGDLAEIRAALARVELEDKLWALPGTLSGGEQQRVALARLLVQGPEVILADEPVSALDVRLGRDVLDLMTTLARERGATLVVSLHDLAHVDRRFDRVIALRGGRVAFECDPAGLDESAVVELYRGESA